MKAKNVCVKVEGGKDFPELDVPLQKLLPREDAENSEDDDESGTKEDPDRSESEEESIG